MEPEGLLLRVYGKTNCTMEHELKTVYTWAFDVVSILLRYFLIAGIGYFLFYVVYRKTFSHRKIQVAFPSSYRIWMDILYSISTLLIYCVTSWIVFQLYETGFTHIYTDIHQFGYTYFFVSLVLMVVLHDAYFYWTHRAMHVSGMLRITHRIHHQSHNPTPWSAFSFHPVEALISIGIIPIIVWLVPCHPYALFAFLTFMTLINVMGHLGYELFPKWMMKHKVGMWQNTSTYHNIHHQLSSVNFGLYFTFWDRIMGTFKPEDSQLHGD